MNKEMFVILFPTVGLLFLTTLLWGPTAFAVLRQKHGSASRIVRRMAFSFLAELVVAASLAFFANQVGLLNPAGYVLAIAFFVGIAGAIAVHRFLPPPVNLSIKRDALKRAP